MQQEPGVPHLSSFTVLVRVKKKDVPTRGVGGGGSTAVPPRMKSGKAKANCAGGSRGKSAKLGQRRTGSRVPSSVAEPQRHWANSPGQPFYREKPCCCMRCRGRHQPKAILQVGWGVGGFHTEKKTARRLGEGDVWQGQMPPPSLHLRSSESRGCPAESGKEPPPLCQAPPRAQRPVPPPGSCSPLRQLQWSFTSSAAAASPWGTAVEGREP